MERRQKATPAGGKASDAEPDSNACVSDQDAAAAATLQQSAQLSSADCAGGGTIRMHHYRTAAQLPPGHVQWAFDLVKASLQTLYEPVWGWSDAKKMTQLEAVSTQEVWTCYLCGGGAT